MSLQTGLGSVGQLAKAIRELQRFKQTIVTGADVNTNIALTGIKTTDAITSVVNLTDLVNIDTTGVKASNGTWGGNLDSVIEATTVGTIGNGIKVGLVGDSALAAGVTLSVSFAPFTFVDIHYESGVSTIADVESAIGSLVDGYTVVAVKTPGTGATVLTSPGDDFVATALAGGVNESLSEIPSITSNDNIQFAAKSTANKKLLVSYYVTDIND